MGVFGYDLSDPSLFDNGFPHRIFTGIRRDRPVAWHYPPDEATHIGGFWSIATYEPVRELLERHGPAAPAPTVVDDALGVAVLELARRSDLWSGLLDGAYDLATAGAELARWISPTTSVSVVIEADLELGGERLAAGETAVCWLASANRDEAVFGRSAMDLDLHRDPNPHLAFLHRHDLLDEFVSRLADLVATRARLVVRGEAEWERSTTRTALSTLPVEFVAL